MPQKLFDLIKSGPRSGRKGKPFRPHVLQKPHVPASEQVKIIRRRMQKAERDERMDITRVLTPVKTFEGGFTRPPDLKATSWSSGGRYILKNRSYESPPESAFVPHTAFLLQSRYNVSYGHGRTDCYEHIVGCCRASDLPFILKLFNSKNAREGLIEAMDNARWPWRPKKMSRIIWYENIEEWAETVKEYRDLTERELEGIEIKRRDEKNQVLRRAQFEATKAEKAAAASQKDAEEDLDEDDTEQLVSPPSEAFEAASAGSTAAETTAENKDPILKGGTIERSFDATEKESEYLTATIAAVNGEQSLSAEPEVQVLDTTDKELRSPESHINQDSSLDNYQAGQSVVSQSDQMSRDSITTSSSESYEEGNLEDEALLDSDEDDYYTIPQPMRDPVPHLDVDEDGESDASLARTTKKVQEPVIIPAEVAAVRALYEPLIEKEPFFRPLLTVTCATRPLAMSITRLSKSLTRGLAYHANIDNHDKKCKTSFPDRMTSLRIDRMLSLATQMAQALAGARGGLPSIRTHPSEPGRGVNGFGLEDHLPVSLRTMQIGVGSWYKFKDEIIGRINYLNDAEVLDRYLSHVKPEIRGQALLTVELDDWGRTPEQAAKALQEADLAEEEGAQKAGVNPVPPGFSHVPWDEYAALRYLLSKPRTKIIIPRKGIPVGELESFDSSKDRPFTPFIEDDSEPRTADESNDYPRQTQQLRKLWDKDTARAQIESAMSKSSDSEYMILPSIPSRKIIKERMDSLLSQFAVELATWQSIRRVPAGITDNVGRPKPKSPWS